MNLFPDANPTSAIPARSARSTASDDGDEGGEACGGGFLDDFEGGASGDGEEGGAIERAGVEGGGGVEAAGLAEGRLRGAEDVGRAGDERRGDRRGAARAVTAERLGSGVGTRGC